RYGVPARVRAPPVVGAVAAQPDRPAAEGPAAVPPQHGRRVGSVSHRTRSGRGARRTGATRAARVNQCGRRVYAGFTNTPRPPSLRGTPSSTTPTPGVTPGSERRPRNTATA